MSAIYFHKRAPRVNMMLSQEGAKMSSLDPRYIYEVRRILQGHHSLEPFHLGYSPGELQGKGLRQALSCTPRGTTPLNPETWDTALINSRV